MKFFADISVKCFNPQVGINKMVNEHTVDYHPSPSELTSNIHLVIFLWTPEGFKLSPEYFWIVFSNLYIAPWLQKSFKFMMLRLLGKAFVSQKIESVHFYLCPQTKIYPRFLSLPLQAGGNYPFPPHNVFCILSQQKGRRLWSWRNDQN